MREYHKEQSNREKDAQEILWLSYSPQVPNLLKDEFAEGWEVDPNFFGVACLEYEIVKVSPWDESSPKEKAFAVGFMILSAITVIFPLLVLITANLRSIGKMKPTQVRVHLRRLKRK